LRSVILGFPYQYKYIYIVLVVGPVDKWITKILEMDKILYIVFSISNKDLYSGLSV